MDPVLSRCLAKLVGQETMLARDMIDERLELAHGNPVPLEGEIVLKCVQPQQASIGQHFQFPSNLDELSHQNEVLSTLIGVFLAAVTLTYGILRVS